MGYDQWLWLIEIKGDSGRWRRTAMHPTRTAARAEAKELRAAGAAVRVSPCERYAFGEKMAPARQRLRAGVRRPPALRLV